MSVRTNSAHKILELERMYCWSLDSSSLLVKRSHPGQNFMPTNGPARSNQQARQKFLTTLTPERVETTTSRHCHQQREKNTESEVSIITATTVRNSLPWTRRNLANDPHTRIMAALSNVGAKHRQIPKEVPVVVAMTIFLRQLILIFHR